LSQIISIFKLYKKLSKSTISGNDNQLIEATDKEDDQLVFEMLKSGFIFKQSTYNKCLRIACSKRNVVIVRYLILSNKIDFKFLNRTVTHGYSILIHAIMESDPDIVTLLLSTGKMEPWRPMNDGFTALMYACYYEDVYLVELLLLTGESNAEYINTNGESALTVTRGKSNEEIEMLIRGEI